MSGAAGFGSGPEDHSEATGYDGCLSVFRCGSGPEDHSEATVYEGGFVCCYCLRALCDFIRHSLLDVWHSQPSLDGSEPQLGHRASSYAERL